MARAARRHAGEGDARADEGLHGRRTRARLLALTGGTPRRPRSTLLGPRPPLGTAMNTGGPRPPAPFGRGHAPVAGRSPATRTPARTCNHRVASRPGPPAGGDGRD